MLRCALGCVLGRGLSTLSLRPYQESCIETCLEAIASGCSRIGVSLPTGTGKTTVFLALLARLPLANEHATKALVIVNSIELARQAAAQAAFLFPKMSIEIEQGQKNVASGMADLTIATYQTLMRGPRITKFDPAQLKAVVIDEAHHAAAPSYRRVLSHFDPAIHAPDIILDRPSSRLPIIGFSATFSRHDGLALASVFQRIVYHRDFLEMIKEQWLCGVRFTSVKARLDLSQVIINTRTGDFNPTSLAHVVNTATINVLVLQTWIDRAAGRRSTLIFCVDLAHVRDLTQTFRDAGVDARYVHSGTPAAERTSLLTDFRAGVFPVLINCAILTEGADVPNIDCIILARPTRSRNLFAQMIGRGMRLSPQTGKEDCHIIDFVDSTGRIAGIVSTPTLFGLEPLDDITDQPLEALEARAEKELQEAEAKPSYDVPDPVSVTYTDYDNPFALVSDFSGCPHISQLSPNAWVGCGEDIYILECLGRGHIRIEPLEASEFHPGGFEAQFTGVIPDGDGSGAPFMRSRRILTAETLSDAVRGCDTFATQRVCSGRMAAGMLRTARWRKDPATPGQVSYIAKRWRLEATDAESGDTMDVQAKKQRIQKMTKGEAANIISRLKNGAQARFDKKLRKMSKAFKAHETEKRRQTRQQVQVGPLLL